MTPLFPSRVLPMLRGLRQSSEAGGAFDGELFTQSEMLDAGDEISARTGGPLRVVDALPWFPISGSVHAAGNSPVGRIRVLDGSADGIRLSAGRHAIVVALDVPDLPGRSRRIIRKKFGRGAKLSRREACTLGEGLRRYRAALEMHGWKLPILYHHAPVREKDGWILVTIEEFIRGGDLYHTFSSSRISLGQKLGFARRIIRIVDKAASPARNIPSNAAGTKLTMLPYGIDLRLQNIVWRDKDPYLVDVFVPRGISKDAPWDRIVCKIEPSHHSYDALCLTREGAVLRFLRLTQWAHGSNHGVELIEFQDRVIDMLQSCRLREISFNFLRDQIRNGYPWLDRVYDRV